MSSIFILVGASLLIAAGFLLAFIWSIKNKQYDDSFGDSIRPLFDNDTNEHSSTAKTIQKSNTKNIT